MNQSNQDLLPANSIAIIGMACRFPGANDLRSFWENLRQGVHALRELSPEELAEAGISREKWQASDYVRRGMVLDGTQDFDAEFFEFPASEARMLDPQQRLLLECSWEALEDAGYPPSEDNRAVAVFMGARISDYLSFNQRPPDLFGITDDLPAAGFQRLLAHDKDYTATRISYKLNLQGPSLTVQTACSTSLVATHLACQSLLNYECDLALAGGASVRVPAKAGYRYSEGMIFSPDGYTRSFDARAQGTIFGSGVGVITLKRLEEAVADGDQIYAILRGSAINNDGSEAKASYTAPSAAGQARVIAEALAVADISPETISYIEAHGTATALGDPIEIAALTEVFHTFTDRRQYCALGTVKSNLGHMVQAAGVAGIIKVALMMQHRTLVPSLHFESPNPQIDFEHSPFFVNTEARPWETDGKPLRAGISSFGFGGTNAHLVLEQAPARSRCMEQPPAEQLLTISARTPQALRELAGRYAVRLAQASPAELADICFTARFGRATFAERLAANGSDPAKIASQLQAFAQGNRSLRLATNQVDADRPPRVAFLFTGQGSQYAGMGREIYEQIPIFRQTLERCQAILADLLPVPLLQVLYPAENQATPLHQTTFTQPALFALEYALAQTWISWGLLPQAVAGHSLGEYVAACVAGALSLEDGLALAVRRGQIMDALEQTGSMATIYAASDQVAGFLDDQPEIEIAAHNGPQNTVITGPAAKVAAFCRQLEADGIGVQTMPGNYAFHSPLIEAALPELTAFTAHLPAYPLAIPFSSALDGAIIPAGEIIPGSYWGQQTRQRVRFLEAMQALDRLGCDTFVEIGPNPVLTALGRGCLPNSPANWLPSLRARGGDLAQLLASLGAAFTAGVPLNWRAFQESQNWCGQRISLPTYPFQRQRYWIDAPAVQPAIAVRSIQREHILLGERLASPLQQVQFQNRLTAQEFPFIEDHKIYGQITMPGTGFVEIVHAAAVQFFGVDGPGEALVEEVTIQRPFKLLEADPYRLHVVISPLSTLQAQVQVYSLAPGGNEWTLHVEARIGRRIQPPFDLPSLTSLRQQIIDKADVDTFYENLRQRGGSLGDSLRGVQELFTASNQALGRIDLPIPPVERALVLHPGMLDSCLQVAIAARRQVFDQEEIMFLPILWEGIRCAGSLQQSFWCHARFYPGESREVRTAEMTLYDRQGRILAHVERVHLKRAEKDIFRAGDPANLPWDWLYQLDWEPVNLPEPQPAQSPRSWLLVGGDHELAADLAAALQASGDQVLLARYSETWTRSTPQQVCYNPLERTQTQVLLDTFLAQNHHQPGGVIYLAGADPANLDGSQPGLARLNAGLLHLSQELLWRDPVGALALWVVTRGAQSTGRDNGPLQPAAASLWGLGRTIFQEQANLPLRLIDLDPASTEQAAIQLARLANTAMVPRQLAWRNKKAYQPSLTQLAPIKDSLSRRLAALHIGQPGVLESLTWQLQIPSPPGPGEVQIRVRASGVNFHDVLTALGRMPEPIGFECSGIIEVCGSGVTTLQPGEAVLALADHSYASLVNVDARRVVRKPVGVSHVQAAGMPMAYTTAYYGLVRLAKLQPGERVLIHSAAGGIGQVAIQIAQMLGAEVYATASRGKWALLRSLGVEKLYDSRSLDFSLQIATELDGDGVDVILNTLAGDFIPASLKLLKRGGRFIELGALDVYDAERMSAERPDVGFFRYRMAHTAKADPQLIQEMLQALLGHLECGELRWPAIQAYPYDQLTPVFQRMAQAQHTGKLVIQLTAESGLRASLPPLRADSSYLISGGLGGLGLQFALWLAEHGAGQLILCSRREPDASIQARLDAIRIRGVRVRCAALDIADAAAVESLLAEIATSELPLRGVIHAAGVLDDGILNEQSWPRFERVFKAKVQGAQVLDQLTRGLPLDFFVLFSSTAALFGNPGQANYAAANAFLDSLARQRQQLGLPGLSINWGLWQGAGMGETLPEAILRQREQNGLGQIEAARGMAILGWALRQGQPQLAVNRVDWGRYLQRYTPDQTPAEFAHLRAALPTRNAPMPGNSSNFQQAFAQAEGDQRQAILVQRLQQHAGDLLGVPAQDLDPQTPLSDYGLDSLAALLLRNQVLNDLPQVKLSVTRFIDGPALNGLAAEILVQTKPQTDPPAQAWEEGNL